MLQADLDPLEHAKLLTVSRAFSIIGKIFLQSRTFYKLGKVWGGFSWISNQAFNSCFHTSPQSHRSAKSMQLTWWIIMECFRSATEWKPTVGSDLASDEGEQMNTTFVKIFIFLNVNDSWKCRGSTGSIPWKPIRIKEASFTTQLISLVHKFL